MAGINTFPVILQLYKKCRGAGIWTKMVLEAENVKEIITFSSVTKSVAAVSLTPAPFKVKKDRKRKEAWLENRSQGKEKPSQTGEISTPEENWLNSTAELESYTQPCFVRSDQIPAVWKPYAVHLVVRRKKRVLELRKLLKIQER